MYITPLTGINPLDITNAASANGTSGTDNSFQNILNDLIQNVNDADQASKSDMYNLAAGNTDDLHTITIDSEKTELSTMLLVQVRNKVLDAYNEIMRVTL